MSVLEKIRSKTGLLVGIVGLALVIFILESLLGSGGALFSNQDTEVGVIAGDKIDYTAFSAKVNEQIAQIQKSNPNAPIDDKTKEQIIESVWSQLINDKVIKVQYKELGISVSEDELYDLMLVHPHQYVIQQLTDQQTGRVYEGFAKGDGTLDLMKLNQWVGQMNPEQEKFWQQLEKSILEVRAAEKYNNLIKKGMYVTTAEAKDQFIAQNKQVNASFVLKRYTSVSDSAVKVSEDEIKAYYNKHQNDYKVVEPSRKIEYVAYDVMPSKADYEALMKDAQRVTEEFKTRTAEEDSSFIAQESEGGQINIANYGKKNMIISDSSVYTAPKGTVFGPYTEGTFVKVYKLTDVKSVADSAKVRHILIGLQSQRTQSQRTPETAKRIADSLLVLLQTKQVKFDTLVKTMSDDMGSLDKGGDYGWFDENKGFVDPFKNAGLQGTVGNISIVPTQFGYHIIEVLNVSKTRHNSYTIAQISKLISPSSETTQEYYKVASDFAGKNTSSDAFEKGVETDKLNKRIAESIKEGDKALPGLEGAKDLVRWVYKAQKGDVSPVFEFKDRFVVAHLVSIKEKGIAPLEDVKEDVTAKAIRDKKAETFIAEFTTKSGVSKSIDDIASKMGLTAEKAENLTFSAFNVASIGREDALIGTATAMKAGMISKPIKGDNGVFVVNVSSVTEAVLPKEFKGKQVEIERMNNGRVDYELFDAIKEKAGIEDHRGKFDF
ncbi:MAG: peptidylprolyl isomerase [Bacteroidota bacterium]|jgi:peptidyl-prolyl cis-trans isomerase D|nr:peptidylprolyl isomerase [Bacteroidota bacterium]